MFAAPFERVEEPLAPHRGCRRFFERSQITIIIQKTGGFPSVYGKITNEFWQNAHLLWGLSWGILSSERYAPFYGKGV